MIRSPGFSLIEAMIAVTIGSILMIGIISIYSQARTAHRTVENLVQLRENLRFARDILRSDVQLANYWGRTNRPETIDRAPDVAVFCRGRDVTRWALDIVAAIEVQRGTVGLPCPTTTPAGASSVLISRHARPAIAAPDSRAIQVRSNGSGGTVISAPVNRSNKSSRNETPGAARFDVVANAWYVSEHSDFDPDVPALRRLSLDGALIHDQEIIAGIDSLRFELGLDTDGDAKVDRWVDEWVDDRVAHEHADARNSAAIVVAVNMILSARSGPPDMLRSELAQTVYLRNAAIRREPGDET